MAGDPATPTPSAAATPSQTPTPTGRPGATPSTVPPPSTAPSGPPALTPAQAEALAAQVRAGTASLEDATAELKKLRAQANAALEAYATAKRTAADARLAEKSAAAKVLTDQEAAADAQVALNRLAAQAYRAGPLNGTTSGLSSLLGASDPAEFLRRAHDVRSAATERSATLRSLQSTVEAGRVAAADADAAAAKATAAEAAVNATAAQRATLVTSASRLVAALAANLSGKGGAAQSAKALSVIEQRKLAEVLARARAQSRGESVLGAGGCKGTDVSAYPNGQLPTDALCPIWGAPGHLLRADAATAFTAMSKAYAAEFGSPICVTDSYRDLPMQQDLFVRKPTLAAVPGTSNHGWGLAADLCDGVQSFGTPQHEWLVANSFQWGWFHPGWAEQSGSRPEPWHWEFSG